MWHRWLSDTLKNRIKVRQERYWQKHFAGVINIYHSKGADTAVYAVREVFDKQTHRENALITLSRHAMKTDVNDAFVFVRALTTESKRIDRLKWCAMAAWDSGRIQFANEILSIPGVMELAASDPFVSEKVLQIEGAWQLINKLPEIPIPVIQAAYRPNQKTMLYVASSSRPYHYTGYTSRTHHLLKAIINQGWNLHCVTRPGYPFDRPDSRNLCETTLHLIDGIKYERLAGKHRRECRYDDYLLQSAAVIEAAAIRLKPAIIQAASNYEAALPALIAARRLGIPFVYEVRGLWEYTAASKKPGWEKTERFELDKRLEGYVASNADHVFTLTGAMADELERRGVKRDRISLIPNGIDPNAFRPQERDNELANELQLSNDNFVVGYVGSIVAYEGLDDLISAVAILVADYPSLRLVIVGDGDMKISLERLVIDKSLTSYVSFTGNVPAAEVNKYFSLFSAIALPRKPYQVCRLVSPLKPLEAMAMNIPMIVSDVEALQEMVTDNFSAIVHKAGMPESLANAIKRLLCEPDLATKLIYNARSEMLPARTWENIAYEAIQILDDLS